MTDADDPAALVAQFSDASLRVVTLFQLNALGDAARTLRARDRRLRLHAQRGLKKYSAA